MKFELRHAVIALLAGSLSFPAIAQSTGKAIFSQQCAVCHGATGKSDTQLGRILRALPLDSPEVKKLSDAALADVVKHGKGKMPEFGTKLSDSQIKEVIAYVRTLQKK